MRSLPIARRLDRLPFMLNALSGAVRITRPLNCLGALGSVILGGYIVSGSIHEPRLWLAAAIAAGITGGGNAINDWFDLKVDSISKPHRVLPSGQLNPSVAAILGCALIALSASASFMLGPPMAAVTVSLAGLALLYSWKLKRTFLIGNLLVSFLSAMTVAYGGLAVGAVKPTLVPAMMVFFFMLSREILKTVEDLEGDSRVGLRTVAVVSGKMWTLRMFSILALMVVLLSPLPWVIGIVSATYVRIALPWIATVMMAAAVILPRHPSDRNIRLTLLVTKLDWLVWLFAMFVGVRQTLG